MSWASGLGPNEAVVPRRNCGIPNAAESGPTPRVQITRRRQSIHQNEGLENSLEGKLEPRQELHGLQIGVLRRWRGSRGAAGPGQDGRSVGIVLGWGLAEPASDRFLGRQPANLPSLVPSTLPEPLMGT